MLFVYKIECIIKCLIDVISDKCLGEMQKTSRMQNY